MYMRVIVPELSRILGKLYESFVSVAAQLQTIHEAVKVRKNACIDLFLVSVMLNNMKFYHTWDWILVVFPKLSATTDHLLLS